MEFKILDNVSRLGEFMTVTPISDLYFGEIYPRKIAKAPVTEHVFQSERELFEYLKLHYSLPTSVIFITKYQVTFGPYCSMEIPCINGKKYLSLQCSYYKRELPRVFMISTLVSNDFWSSGKNIDNFLLYKLTSWVSAHEVKQWLDYCDIL